MVSQVIIALKDRVLQTDLFLIFTPVKYVYFVGDRGTKKAPGMTGLIKFVEIIRPFVNSQELSSTGLSHGVAYCLNFNIWSYLREFIQNKV